MQNLVIGVGKGSRNLRLKICDPVHISGSGKARNFKFGTRIDQRNSPKILLRTTIAASQVV